MKIVIELIITLIPFVMLFSGFLVFHAGSLKTTIYTCLVELLIVIAYFHVSVGVALAAAIWGTITLWAPAILFWIGQLFGEAFNETGLMDVLLKSFESIFPAKDKVARTMAPIALLSGFVCTFGGQAGYPVVIPILTKLGFSGAQAGAASLVFASWLIPFSSVGMPAVVAAAATHMPITRFVGAMGWYAIPLCFTCTYATLRILGFRFFQRETQLMFWITCLSFVLGLVLFTIFWPEYYAIPLLAGALFMLLAVTIYGRMRRRQDAGDATGKALELGALTTSAVPEHAAVAAAGDSSVLTAPVPPSGTEARHRLSATESILIPHPPQQLRTSNGATRASRWTTVQAYGPMLVALLYILLSYNPVIGHSLARFQWTFSAWGMSPVVFNPLTTPAFPILVAAIACYFFRVNKQRPVLAAFARDFAESNRHGISTMETFALSCSIMYLMSYTGQITFLGHLLSSAGATVYQLFDATIIMAGGTIFGAGTPAIFIFSQMQIPAAKELGLPVILLLGLVVVGALGSTNGMKPPNVRFAAALAHMDENGDNEIFRIGMKWVSVQAVLTTILTFIYVPFWR